MTEMRMHSAGWTSCSGRLVHYLEHFHASSSSSSHHVRVLHSEYRLPRNTSEAKPLKLSHILPVAYETLVETGYNRASEHADTIVRDVLPKTHRLMSGRVRIHGHLTAISPLP
jgi:hypothetical protein